MADGGWSYYSHTELPHNGSQADEQASMAAFQAALEATPGWSRHTDQAVYNSRCLWWSLENDATGARVLFAYAGDGSTGSVILGENAQDGASRTASSYEGTLWVCYVPASFSATALGSNPANADLLPANSMRFVPFDGLFEVGSTTAGYRHQTHWMVRGDGMILLRATNTDSASAIDRFHLMGECLDPLRHAAHPTEPDTGANAKVAHLTLDGASYSSSRRFQFYHRDGTWRNDPIWLSQTAVLGQDVCEGPPWSWENPTVYVSETDLDNQGIVTGNGIKGVVSSEWLRFVSLTGGPVNPKQQLDGGNFVYIGGGIAVGYDPTNGGMS